MTVVCRHRSAHCEALHAEEYLSGTLRKTFLVCKDLSGGMVSFFPSNYLLVANVGGHDCRPNRLGAFGTVVIRVQL